MQAKLQVAPPPTRFGQGATVQRAMQIDDDVDYESFGDSGASEDEGKRLKIRGKVSESNVHIHYRERKKKFRKRVKDKKFSPFSSANLKFIVDEFETGHSGANTHILVRDGTKTTLHQANTANGVKLVIRKFRYKKARIGIGEDGRALGTRIKKKLKRKTKVTNIHTEMNVLYNKVNGNASLVKNALTGIDVIVDKACCKMCYQWMKEANANVIDGTKFPADGIGGREAFAWTNPFTGDSIEKSDMSTMTPLDIEQYVTDAIK